MHKPAYLRRGFTLIELLTVIAIIGILAAILIPTVGMVRKKARSADCVSRLRQLGTAVALYADENRGMAPPWRGSKTDPSASYGVLWYQALIRYMSMRAGNAAGSPVLAEMPPGTDYSQVPGYFYMCPDSTLPVKGRSWGSYAVHPEIMKENAGGPFFKLSKIKRPSQVILIADGSQNNSNPDDTSFFSIYGSASDGAGGYFGKSYAGAAGKQIDDPLGINPNRDSRATVGYLRHRHNNNVNCLFVDGHVASKGLGTLTYGNMIEDR